MADQTHPTNDLRAAIRRPDVRDHIPTREERRAIEARWAAIQGDAYGPKMAAPEWRPDDPTTRPAVTTNRVAEARGRALLAEWAARGDGVDAPTTCDVCGARYHRDPHGQLRVTHLEARHQAAARRAEAVLEPPRRVASEDDDDGVLPFSRSRSSGVPLGLRQAGRAFDPDA